MSTPLQSPDGHMTLGSTAPVPEPLGWGPTGDAGVKSNTMGRVTGSSSERAYIDPDAAYGDPDEA